MSRYLQGLKDTTALSDQEGMTARKEIGETKGIKARWVFLDRWASEVTAEVLDQWASPDIL